MNVITEKSFQKGERGLVRTRAGPPLLCFYGLGQNPGALGG